MRDAVRELIDALGGGGVVKDCPRGVVQVLFSFPEWKRLQDALAAVEAQGWQPIETAPKEGTEIDLWTPYGRRPDCRWNVKRGYWEELGIGGFDTWEWCKVEEQATHWMPLPEPPKEVQGEN